MTSRLLLALSVASVAGPALGQASSPPEPDEVIIVTAQKRAQAADDIGMSIDIVSARELDERGITSIAALERAVPGLTYTLTPSGPPVLTIRGIGFYDSTLAAAPAVSIYVDEAPLALPIFAQVAPIDLARIEILKGPQGTLYGENSTGGAINYVAARPTDRFEAGGSFSFGRFSRFEADGHVSGPLTQNLKARLAFRTAHSGDWQKSYTRDDELGEVHQTAGRAILSWAPRAAVRIGLTLNGWIDKSDSQAFQLQAVACAVPSNCPPELLAYPLAPANARAADWSPDWPMTADDRFGQAVLRADIDVADSITLTAIGGWQSLKQDKYIDQDATAIEDLNFRQQGDATSHNVELRLAGKTGHLDWLAGAYLSKAKVDEIVSVRVSQASTNLPIPGLFPAFTTARQPFEQDVTSQAGFGHAEYRFTGWLTASAGLRYTRTARAFSGCTGSGADPTLGRVFTFLGALLRGELPNVPPPPADGCFQLDRITLQQLGATRDRLEEDNISFRLGLDYRTAGDSLLYANVSRGYKSGSFPTVSASNSAQYLPVTQESVLAYEAGMKAPLFGGAAQIEAAAFYYDYNDKQLRGRILDPVFGALETLVNIPKSRVWGIEAGITARPARGLTLVASATYIDSKIEQFTGVTPTGTTRDFAGSAFPYSPKWQAVADAGYRWPVGQRLEAFLGAGLTWRSEAFAALGEDSEFRLKPYALLDLRAGLGMADGQWRVSLFGRNVTNVYSWNNVFQFIDTRFRVANPPATYGVKLDFRFLTERSGT